MAIDEKLYAERCERNKNIYDLRQSGRTLSEIGSIYGISMARVSQIYMKECRRKREYERDQFLRCIYPPRPTPQEYCAFAQSWKKSMLATRAFNAFMRAGIRTNEELILRYQQDKCMGIKNVGVRVSEYIGEYIKTITQEQEHDGK